MARWGLEQRGESILRVNRPWPNWRCYVWLVGLTWNWEARRFGRHELHLSGECEKLQHAKLVAVAAATAIHRRGKKSPRPWDESRGARPATLATNRPRLPADGARASDVWSTSARSTSGD